MFLLGFPETEESPIPEFKPKTWVEVKNPRNGAIVLTQLIDRGPAVWTGAPIDLTADVKQVLGYDGDINFLVEFQILEDEQDDGPISTSSDRERY